ncbi:hypothetical protein TURU_103085 [Turdus rufiventris]|nr:hypothetical protein TURU_103085 [Turdus rufiventris]
MLDLRLPVAAYEGNRSFADGVAGVGPAGHAVEAEILETSLTRSCQKALTNLRSVCRGPEKMANIQGVWTVPKRRS